jgi:hypothetical protein
MLFHGDPESALAQESPAGISYKIGGAVQQVLRHCDELQARGVTDLSLSNGVLRVSESGEIDLLFHAASPTSEVQEADLIALGATILGRLRVPPELRLPPLGLIEARLPHDAVEAAAALPWVVAVTTPGYGEADPHPTNPINSEGVALHNADLLQAQGVDGTGVTVGAISTGVANLAQSQAQNELPAVTVLNTNALDEGTAMLEIIHDMAPGATLLYDDGAGTAAAGVMRHFNALNNLVANGADVIAEDLAFAAEPAFQQGLLATTAEAIAAAGVSVHSSAGNRATNHTARVAAAGTGGGPDGVNFGAAPPGCANIPDNVVAIAPGGDTTFDVTLQQNAAGTLGARFTLQWSEPRAIFPTPGQGGFTDLNLYVMDMGLTQCLGQSVAVQANGQGDTLEVVALPAGLAGTAAKLVVDVQGTSSAVAAPTLDLRWRRATAGNPGEDNPTRAGSLNPDSNYIGLATSSAAVNALFGTLQAFSSGGPVQLGLTTVCPGGGPGPCAGVAGPALANSLGPTWAAADNVAISGVGGFGTGTCPAVNPGDCRFLGTSAAAPHAAACDALIRDAIGAPASPVLPILNRLVNGAVDMGAPGPDNATGAGLLDCDGSVVPTAVCQDITVPTDPGVCNAAVDPMQVDDGSFDPDGGALTKALVPPGPFDLGGTAVELTVTDPDGLSDACAASVTVVDEEPAVLQCNTPASATMVPPDAPISFTASATDNCGPTTVVITEFDCFKFTKKGKRIDKTESCQVTLSGDTITIEDSGGVGDSITWKVTATDAAGNPAMIDCGVLVVKP